MYFIKLTKAIEYRVDANNIIKSVIQDKEGNWYLRSDLLPKIKIKLISDKLKLITKIDFKRISLKVDSDFEISPITIKK